MVYEDTIPVDFRELLNLSVKNLEKSHILILPSLFTPCCFDYARLREVVTNVGDVTAEMNLCRVVYKDVINLRS